jgi:tau tubulin kinase
MKFEKKRVCIKENTRVGPFIIGKQIGHGGYGDVYVASRPNYKRKYAIKFELLEKDRVTLEHEVGIINAVTQRGFPVVRATGSNKEFRWFAMDLYGKSFSQLRRMIPNRKFPLDFVMPIADETFKLITKFHKLGYIHCDIKPSNFVAHRKKSEPPIILIDFGFAKQHIDPNTGRPYPRNNSGSFIGTTMYASINALSGGNLGRCDDLLSWFYMIAELVQGKLPWSSYPKNQIKAAKKAIAIEELCRGMPYPLVSVYKHLQALRYEDEPDYDFISKMLVESNELCNTANDEKLWEAFDEFMYGMGDDEEEEESSEYCLTFSAHDEACRI